MILEPRLATHHPTPTTKELHWSPQLALLWDLSSSHHLCAVPFLIEPQDFGLKSQGIEAGKTMQGSTELWAYDNSGSRMIMVQRPQNLGFRTIMVQLYHESNYSL